VGGSSPLPRGRREALLLIRVRRAIRKVRGASGLFAQLLQAYVLYSVLILLYCYWAQGLIYFSSSFRKGAFFFSVF